MNDLSDLARETNSETEAWGEFQEVINGGNANSTLNKLAANWKELKDEY